jgi:hypothetical protein
MSIAGARRTVPAFDVLAAGKADTAFVAVAMCCLHVGVTQYSCGHLHRGIGAIRQVL